ncbi:Hypothetical protein EAG7_02000 [Klebsiella aerogenes]|nr:Hypothetical protein EAG7_02000 [Klebsiella aerogenes]CCG30476.1 hypothetical protein [Klebsiella aerogenes EA1509E]
MRKLNVCVAHSTFYHIFFISAHEIYGQNQAREIIDIIICTWNYAASALRRDWKGKFSL